ncbi:MAG: Holliday junction resolvase RuvX [Patescibacteria group bacterium]
MNYLGLDWGKRKIGVAIAEGEVKIASPILVLKYNGVNEAMEKIKKLIVDEEINVIVIGRPMGLKVDAKISVDYLNFVSRLEKLGVKIEEVDERMTTRMSIRLKTQFDPKRNKNDDEVAAALILQTYLDRL